MDDRYRRMIFRRAHNALKTPHHRRLSRHRLEPCASRGMWQLMWLGSRMNESGAAD